MTTPEGQPPDAIASSLEALRKGFALPSARTETTTESLPERQLSLWQRLGERTWELIDDLLDRIDPPSAMGEVRLYNGDIWQPNAITDPATEEAEARAKGQSIKLDDIRLGEGSLSGDDAPIPSLRVLQGALWRHFKDIHGSLESASDVIVEKTIEALDRAEWSDITAETVNLPIARGLPSSSEDLMFLPPHLFGNLDDPTWRPHVPQTAEELEALRNRYLAGANHGWVSGGRSKDSLATSDERFIDFLQKLQAQGTVELDDQAWEQYRQASLAQAATGQYQMDALASFRLQASDSFNFWATKLFTDRVNARRVTHSLGVIDRPDTRHQSMGNQLVPSDHFVLPVGEYGEAWTEKLIRLGVYTKRQATKAATNSDVDQSARSNNEAITKHTARGSRSPAEVPPGERLSYVGEEGALSEVQTINLLTACKVPGYEGPESLARDIIAAGLVDEFTRAVPAGIVAPFALAGLIIPDIVEPNPKGGVQLNPTVMAHLKDFKHTQVGIWASQLDEHIKSGGKTKLPEGLGLICPAAMPHGAIAKLSNALTKFF
jgi:hypothetical protein